MATVQAVLDAAPFEAGARRVEASTKRVNQAARQSRNELGQFQKNTSLAGKAAAGAANQLKLFIGAFGALIIVKKTISVLTGFQNTMAEISGVTGVPRATEEFQKFTDVTRELGATTKFSAQQAGEGLLFLARAGFSAADSVAALPATLNLAIAGVLQLGEAADIASNLVKQFGLNASETVRVVDTLINTANSANTDVRQLAEAMKFVGPVAGALGKTVEETAAAVGALGDAGIQASLAGTNLRGMMAQLLGPTTKARDAFARMGVDLEDLDVEANSLADIFETLADSGLTAAEAVQIFGRRNVSAALVLATSTDKMRELTKANEDSAGVAEKNAKIMSDTLGGAALSLKSAFEELILVMGDGGLGTVFRSTVDFLTVMVRTIAGVKTESTAFQKVAVVLGYAIKGATVGLIAYTLHAGYAAVATKLAGVSVVGLSGALKGLWISLGPVGISIAAISALAAAFFALQDSFKETTESATSVTLSMSEFNDEIERFNKLTGREERLLQLGDVEGVADVFESKASVLRGLSEDLRASLQAGETVWGSLGDLQKIVEGEESLLEVRRKSREELSRVFGGIVGTYEELPEDIEFSGFKVSIQDAISAVEKEIKRLELRARNLPIVAEAFDRIKSKVVSATKAMLGLNEVKPLTEEQLESLANGEAALLSMVEALEFQLEMVGKDAEAREKASAIRKAEQVALATGAELTTDLRSEILRLIETRYENERAIKAELEAQKRAAEVARERVQVARTWIAERIEAALALAAAIRAEEDAALDAAEAAQAYVLRIKDEADLVGLSNEAREKMILLRRFDAANIDNQTEATARLRRELELEIETLQKSERIQGVADDLAAAFTGALESVLLNVNSLEDALENLARAIQKIILQELLLTPLKNALSASLFAGFGGGGSGGGNLDLPAGADGMVIGSGGNIIPFAGGGILNDPAYFSLAGGRVGLAGEAGPEAILPLTNIGGRLGVESTGSGGNITQNITIQTPDARSFHNSRRQVMADIKKGLQ